MDARYDFVDYLPGQWVRVESSWVAAVRWSVNGVLEVRTDRGKTLPYGGVPEGVFRRLLEAESKGTFVNRVVKPGYDFLGER